jgi:hypothetical protein
LDGSIPGTATAGKALVLNGSASVSGINALSATQLTGTIQTGAQPLITSVTSLDITGHDSSTTGLRLAGNLLLATAPQLNALVDGTASPTFANSTITGNLTLLGADGSTTGLILASTLVTATGAELNYVDTTPGTAAPFKAMVLDTNRNIANVNALSAAQLTGTIQTGSQPLITSVATLDITNAGLRLSGDLVTATATKLNYVDTTPGVAVASKALVLDTNSSITGIAAISATSITGTLQTPSQPNITSVGTLTSITTSGTLTMGSTTISETEISVLDSVTRGTAQPDKALVFDANTSIAGVNSLSTTKLAVGGPANSNLPLEVGSVLYQFSGSYAYSNADNAHGMVSMGNGQTGAYSLRADGRILCTGEIQITSDRRLKKNITNIELDLAKRFVQESRPVRYNWVSGDDIVEYGFVAQEIIKIEGINETVTVMPQPGLQEELEGDRVISPAGHKLTISTGKMIPLLTLCTRDLYTQIDERDVKIAALEERLARLEPLLARLDL